MQKITIFQKSNIENSVYCKTVESFNNCTVKLSQAAIEIFDNGLSVLKSELKLQENDITTDTHIGYFSDGQKFRLLKPNETSLQRIKVKFDCLDAFGIASLNPDGYAIHFIVVDKNNGNVISVSEKDINYQIGKLINACVISLNFKVDNEFINLSKRLIKLISNRNDLLKFKEGQKVLNVIKQNINLYDRYEKSKII